MLRSKRTLALTAVAASVALGATACGGSSGGGSGSSGSGSASKGGTLVYYAPSDFDHIDPQRVYTAQGQNIDEEIARTLTSWDQKPGEKTPKLAGDLATDTGTSSDGAKTWTFHLRTGVKWQDGSAVTAQDVKYGIERGFSPDINGGPPYAATDLVGGADYKGPYQGKSLDSIETPDAHTIIFHLNSPHADFNETTAMSGWSAVPKAHDTGATYDQHVWSDGPYQIKSYAKNKELVLVKNPNWTAASDPLREQNVDEIDVKMGQDQAATDQLMKADGPTAQNAIIDDPVAGTDLSSFANDPTLKSRFHTIPTLGINYMAINVNTVKDIRVREAIEYAVNKATVRGAFGGSAYGSYATTMLPPGIDGHKDFSLYGDNPNGDPAKAKALLAQAGVKNLSLSFAIENDPTWVKVGDAVKNALAGVGITVNLVPITKANYFSTIDNIDNHYDLTWVDWFADWPNASTILPTLFDGRLIAKNPQANQDQSYLNDPAINKQFDTIAAMSDPAQANAAYGDLDEQILKQASVVPLVYMTVNELQGSKVGGLVDDPVDAEMKLTHVFVKN